MKFKISIKYQKIRFLGSDKPRTLFFQLINIKNANIVGILTFMNSKNFMFSGVEHENSFITSGPVYSRRGF